MRAWLRWRNRRAAKRFDRLMDAAEPVEITGPPLTTFTCEHMLIATKAAAVTCPFGCTMTRRSETRTG